MGMVAVEGAVKAIHPPQNRTTAINANRETGFFIFDPP